MMRMRCRPHYPGECSASECSLMCNDFLRLNYSSIIVDPGVRLAYATDAAELPFAAHVVEAPVTSWADVLADPIDEAMAIKRPLYQCASPALAVHVLSDSQLYCAASRCPDVEASLTGCGPSAAHLFTASSVVLSQDAQVLRRPLESLEPQAGDGLAGGALPACLSCRLPARAAGGCSLNGRVPGAGAATCRRAQPGSHGGRARSCAGGTTTCRRTTPIQPPGLR